MPGHKKPGLSFGSVYCEEWPYSMREDLLQKLIVQLVEPLERRLQKSCIFRCDDVHQLTKLIGREMHQHLRILHSLGALSQTVMNTIGIVLYSLQGCRGLFHLTGGYLFASDFNVVMNQLRKEEGLLVGLGVFCAGFEIGKRSRIQYVGGGEGAGRRQDEE